MVLTPEEKKERKRIYNIKYREQNRELIRRKARENYNKEQKKAYYDKNKDYILEKKKDYYKSNKEIIREKEKAYIHTKSGMKSKKISNWKTQGLISLDYDIIYERYINTTHCDICCTLLTKDKFKECTKTTKCMDHDHITGMFRNILCLSCNSSLPKQDNELNYPQ